MCNTALIKTGAGAVSRSGRSFNKRQASAEALVVLPIPISAADKQRCYLPGAFDGFMAGMKCLTQLDPQSLRTRG